MYPWKPCSRRRGPLDATFPDTHLTACNLHCSGATAAWRAMLVMLHGMTGGPAMSHGLQIWCPVYGHAAQRSVLYCSQDNRMAFTNCGLLTRYMCDGAFDGAFKLQSTLRLMICVYGCAEPAVLIIHIRLIFVPLFGQIRMVHFSTIRCRIECE